MKLLARVFSPNPKSKIANPKSFYDPIRPLQYSDWDRQTKFFCCFEVNDELELRCLLHRQISRLGAFQYLIHVNSRLPVEVSEVRPIGHESTGFDKFILWINSRQAIFTGKLAYPLSFRKKAVSDVRHDRAHLLLLCC